MLRWTPAQTYIAVSNLTTSHFLGSRYINISVEIPNINEPKSVILRNQFVSVTNTVLVVLEVVDSLTFSSTFDMFYIFNYYYLK